MGSVLGTAQDALFIGVGGAINRTVGGMIPIGGTPVTDLAKGIVLGELSKMLTRRFLGPDRSRFLAAGVLYPSLKSALTSMVPATAPFLGDYADYAGLAAYSLPALAGVDDTLGGVDDTLGSYSMGIPGM